MTDPQKRPVIVLLTSHWLTMAGVALVTLAGFSWLFALPAHSRQCQQSLHRAAHLHRDSRRVLRGTGPDSHRHRARQAPRCRRPRTAFDRQAAWRRAGMFFAVMTMANLVIGSQLTYRAVEHMETNQFCGQSCHVMKPEFTAHLLPPHQASPASPATWPGATGWVKSKMAGTRQLMGVMLNNYPAAHRIGHGEQPAGLLRRYL